MSQRIRDIPREQVSEEVMRPNRPSIEQIYTLVSDAAGVSRGTVLDRHVPKDVFQVTVYLHSAGVQFTDQARSCIR
jgi:hypothetical protein